MIRLPNTRKLFVPDRGYTIVDADLSGADAQVVAWEAGDENLKAAFRRGIKIHVHNARTMFDECKDMTDEEIKSHPTIYRGVKAGCHALNYGATVPALMANIGWEKGFASEFRERWFFEHPQIREWHHRYERYLHGTQCWNCDEFENLVLGKPCTNCGKPLGMTIKNRFGFRIRFFGRPEQLLPEALAWTPQSTVAFCTELGWTAIAEGTEYTCLLGHGAPHTENWTHLLVESNSYNKWHNIVQFLIQVHDSIVFQVPRAYEEDIPQIVDDMRVIVPYDDPLIIPMGYKQSRISWGET